MTIESSIALQYFIQKNHHKNLAQLAFKKTLVEGYDNRFVLNQLYGKQKAKNKLPYLFNNDQILYPVKVSVEQSSSEKTAIWKANLVEGATLLDMTGGFGVDTYHFSKRIQQVTYLEKNTELFDIVRHNYTVLNADNITTINGDSLGFLENTQHKFDWIYLDPARRDEVGNRKIGLAGYFPNLLDIQPLLFQKTEKVLVKVSPMLDIQQAIQQLGTVQKVMVLAVQNEVKELLLILEKAGNTVGQSPAFECVDLRKDGTVLNYQSNNNQDLSNLRYSLPKNYIYEPNAAILKAGLFKEIAIDFKLNKLHSNTHLYTSEQLVADFPGRIFKLKGVENFNKKAIAPYLENRKANITTRNFPYAVAQIKKKLGVKDGGNVYLFATTLQEEQFKILVCEKL
ncbi:MAG: rRNA adenine N-6-methyltransferase family protein [Saprospiraceae bacterium]